jgi:hypothetical protein
MVILSLPDDQRCGLCVCVVNGVRDAAGHQGRIIAEVRCRVRVAVSAAFAEGFGEGLP